jgi:O-succinylbenzoate synthase
MREKAQVIRMGKAYISADFSSRIPNTNHLHVTRNESFALALLPIKHKTGIPIAWDELR